MIDRRVKGCYTYVVLFGLLRMRTHACAAGWHNWFCVYDLLFCDASRPIGGQKLKSYIHKVRAVSETKVS